MKNRLLLTFIILLAGSASFVNGQTITVVTLDLPNPCASITTNIDKIVKKDVEFTLSPNPTKGRFTINITRKETIGKVKIKVFDMKGTLVFTDEIYSNNQKCIKTYNLSKLSKGIYNVSIIGKEYRESKKLVIN